MTLTTKQKIGNAAEDRACVYLCEQGLELVLRNYRCKLGEVDLIMLDKKSLVFVEVRYRKQGDFGNGLESISRHKQSKLIRTATFYLQANRLTDKIACRFDAISLADDNKIVWIKDAFQVQYRR